MSYSNVWAELVFIGFPKKRCLNDCVHYCMFFGASLYIWKINCHRLSHMYTINNGALFVKTYISQGYAGQI